MNHKLLTLFVVFVSFTGISQYTEIPDSNFEQALIDLGLDAGEIDGQVLTANITNVKEINLAEKSIASLQGIEDFIALELLNCSRNSLRELDLSKNIMLKGVTCSLNSLNSLNLKNLTELGDLNCSSNELEELDLSENVNLRKVNCSLNQLSSFEASNLKELTVLGCRRNNLKELDLRENANLRKVDCSRNQLTSLTITNLEALRELDCDQNNLKELDLSGNTSLQEVNCSENLLASLNLEDLNALEILICKENQLQQLNLSNNAKLRRLDCSLNNLTLLNLKNGSNEQLSAVNTRDNSDLKCILIDDEDMAIGNDFGNFYRNWRKDDQSRFTEDCDADVTDRYVIIPDINFERRLQQYDNRTGRGDGLIPIANIMDVTELDLGITFNDIEDLTGIEGFLSLEKLRCPGNAIQELDLSKNIKLKELICYGNKIQSLDVSKNALLEKVDVSGNELQSINLESSINLQILDVSENKLSELDISYSPNILSINCSSNELISLKVKNLSEEPFITAKQFNATRNPNLGCIEVDYPEDASNGIGFYVGWKKDAAASYDSNCNVLNSDENIRNEGVMVYPNPSNGVFRVSSSSGVSHIDITDIRGTLVRSFSPGSNQTTAQIVDLTDFAKGVYFFQIHSNGKFSSKTVVIE